MYLIKSKEGWYYTGADLSLKQRRALRFLTLREAQSELAIMRDLGRWPLCTWSIVKIAQPSFAR